MTLQNEFDAVFPRFKIGIEGHATLTEKTCDVIKRIYDIAKPEKMLEIGFNAGHSAFGWLTLCPELQYHSIDICKHRYTKPHAKKIKELFGDRFMFGAMNSMNAQASMIKDYDMIFIDGDHEAEGLAHDYRICKEAKTKWILIDDYTLRSHIYSLIHHIDKSESHPYELVEIFEYDDHTATTQAALFRRTD